MAFLPEPISSLIGALSKLPGIGPRSAERIALHLVQAETGAVKHLAETILSARERVRFCELCGALTEQQPCQLCTDPQRDATLLIEFARGGQDGFRKALGMLDRAVLDGAAIFHIQVSREESWRRNVARYQEKLRHSILAHMVPRETYDYFYDVNDWEQITGGQPSGWISVNGVAVPFVSMNNEPESTDPAVLEPRYGAALDTLWALRSSRR